MDLKIIFIPPKIYLGREQTYWCIIPFSMKNIEKGIIIELDSPIIDLLFKQEVYKFSKSHGEYNTLDKKGRRVQFPNLVEMNKAKDKYIELDFLYFIDNNNNPIFVDDMLFNDATYHKAKVAYESYEFELYTDSYRINIT